MLIFIILLMSQAYGKDLFQMHVYGKGVTNYQFYVNHLEMKIKAAGMNRKVEFKSCAQSETEKFLKDIKEKFERYSPVKGATHTLNIKLGDQKKDVLILSKYGMYLKQLPKKFLFLEKTVRQKCQKS